MLVCVEWQLSWRMLIKHKKETKLRMALLVTKAGRRGGFLSVLNKSMVGFPIIGFIFFSGGSHQVKEEFAPSTVVKYKEKLIPRLERHIEPHDKRMLHVPQHVPLRLCMLHLGETKTD